MKTRKRKKTAGNREEKKKEKNEAEQQPPRFDYLFSSSPSSSFSLSWFFYSFGFLRFSFGKIPQRIRTAHSDGCDFMQLCFFFVAVVAAAAAVTELQLLFPPT